VKCVDDNKVRSLGTESSEKVNPHVKIIICAGVANYCVVFVLKCMAV